MRTILIFIAGPAVIACSSPRVDERLSELGDSGGWDYNTDTFNPGLERLALANQAPYGRVAHTLDPYSYLMFELRSTEPVGCVSRDPQIDAVTVVGSGDVAGTSYGPRVMVHRGQDVAPLAIGEHTAVAAVIRSQAMDAADAIPVVLQIERVKDVVRPGGWIRWPHYAVTLYDENCQATWRDVAIFGPAFAAPTSANQSNQLVTVPGAVVTYSGFYDGVVPALITKAAVLLDAPLDVPTGPTMAEDKVSAQVCTNGVALAPNELAFLGSLTIGAAVVAHLPWDLEEHPIIVFRTRRGQPFKAHASAMLGGVAFTICHRDDFAPEAVEARVPNQKLAWPEVPVTEIDVIHASSFAGEIGEVAASTFTWVASGTSQRRKEAFLGDDYSYAKWELSQTADQAIAGVNIKSHLGAIGGWSALNALLADRVSLVLVAETLPPERASESLDYEMEQAMSTPIIGDGICSEGEAAMGSPDCPVAPPAPAPTPTPTPDASAELPVDEPAPTPTPTPDASPTPTPDASPSPTPTPDASPSPVPDESPTPSPSPSPSPEPPPPPPSTPSPTPGSDSGSAS
jgi:hypothetical protein